MTLSETKERILAEDTEFILSEHKKLRTLYALKKEIRYDRVRETPFATESVAEHVYGMHCLCDYFLYLDERLVNADVSKIRIMIQYHDIDEIKTGDIVNYQKNSNLEEEFDTAKEVVMGLPSIMRASVLQALKEYYEQTTIEAKFVKALDKVEPSLQCYDEEMKKVLLENKVSLQKGLKGKPKYLAEFPAILSFNNVVSKQMIQEGFFVTY